MNCEWLFCPSLWHYLSKLQSNRLRRNFTSLRLGSHKLDIESGRFHNIPRENRLCQQGVVESEFHFLLCCNHYQTLRDTHYGNMPWSKINTFNSIMSRKIKSKLLNTSKYIMCFTLCCRYISLSTLMSFLFLFVPACVFFVCVFSCIFLYIFVYFCIFFVFFYNFVYIFLCVFLCIFVLFSW